MGLQDLKPANYEAAGQTLNTQSNGLAICNCETQPDGLHVSCDSQLIIKVNNVNHPQVTQVVSSLEVKIKNIK
jgi:hypothetical protein